MGKMMKVRNAYTVGNGNKAEVAIGRLEELQSFGNRPAMARGLPENMPFLTFPLKAHEACRIPSSVENFNFGLGHLQLSDRMLMTMRLQLVVPIFGSRCFASTGALAAISRYVCN
ncbi:hypothetical protein [Burkholderia sp. BCC1985]|uniref:hypothetical protein n=1 Tax=Burkholderia sp. BCC1985 TaxID=2817442 RepID=UPI002AB2771A|nr:hypothetical protein [Burkholderia sp. BCC1985]